MTLKVCPDYSILVRTRSSSILTRCARSSDRWAAKQFGAQSIVVGIRQSGLETTGNVIRIAVVNRWKACYGLGTRSRKEAQVNFSCNQSITTVGRSASTRSCSKRQTAGFYPSCCGKWWFA